MAEIDVSGAARGRRIGRYEIAGHLAAGGMAEVLLGRLLGPSGFERVVVVKRILPHLASQRSFVNMFLDEARIAARIHHPNVVHVHELSQEEDGELFLAMEYLEGESVGGLMRRLARREKTIDPTLAAYVIAEACAGIHAAHELTDDDGHPLNVIHRDISPQNIFVTYGGGVKILDFGIAKARDQIAETEAGQIKGKFAYMSPEQARGKALDRGSDVFALGILLYELSTGVLLFKRESGMATLAAICQQPVPPPSSLAPAYPPGLESICLRALQKQRRDRYATAGEMRRDLLAWIRRSDGSATDPAEALRSLMTDLFVDRIDDKKDMLRRIRSGSAVTRVPAVESDGGVELPTCAAAMIEDGTNASVQTNAPQPARPRRLTALLMVAAVAGTTVAVGSWLRFDTPSPNAAVSDTAPAARVEVTPGASSASPAPAETVSWTIETSPPGARITIAGADHGTSPTKVSLPKSESVVSLTASRDGYEPYEQRLAPTANWSLSQTLVPKKRGFVAPARPVVAPTVTPSSAPAKPNWEEFTPR